ncbi:MAG TPA: signal peptidase I [Candidatus Cybelea sp.]|nr:signal peptidase I [Candidatus Cybelea sp.]
MSSSKRGSIAFLLSIAVPGLGQIYNGQILAGVLSALAFASFFLLAGLLGLFLKFSTAAAYAASIWAFQLAVAIHAAIVAAGQVRNNAVPRQILRSYALGALLLAAVAIALTFPVDRIPGVRGYKVASQSMSPTLIAGDRFAVDVRYYKTHRPERSDVVVFRTPTGDEVLTKRVIAVEGDTIVGGPDGIIVNGKLISEPYLPDETGKADDNSSKFGPVSIPPNGLFVMGDNRAESYDSRHFGPVGASSVMGKALYVYYSTAAMSRIGKTIQ